MNEQWDTANAPSGGGDGQTPAPSAPEQVSVTEQSAASMPSQPESTPPTPPQTPINSWSSDGSYRYVPGRENGAQTPPPQPPRYQSPAAAPGGAYWQPAPQPPKPPRKKNNGWIVAVAIIGAIGIIGAIVCLGLATMHAVKDSGFDSPNSNTTEISGAEDAPALEISSWDDDDGGLSTREVVNRNLDSTVVLTVYTQSRNFQFGESNLTQAGVASGIVMSAEGYIITNWHCVTNESTGKPYDKIEVSLHDGTIYEAEVVGSDETTDLAVIKVEATGLSVAEFGDSSALQIGDRVIALGNAAGLSWTATQGIVSALARDVYDDTGYALKCLQTDAAINPGNSGGPLLNNQGLVVGINSSKIVASGYEGLGFSIPINEAKAVVDSLLQNGYVKGRVALGITGQTVSSGTYKGFMIATINEKSSLRDTEAQVGDLIVAVDGVSITDYGELRSELAKHSVGDRVTLDLLRSDSRTGRVTSMTVSVVLQEQTAE